MSMLAETKIKKRKLMSMSVMDTKTSWNSQSNFGSELMQKLGWSKGQGLGKNKQGHIAPIKTKTQIDLLGLGAKEESLVPQHFDKLEAALFEINEKFVGKEMKSTNTVQDFVHTSALACKKKIPKNINQLSEKELKCIFGFRQSEKPKTEDSDTEKDKNSNCQFSTNSIKIQDYFATKIKALRAKRQEGILADSTYDANDCDQLPDMDFEVEKTNFSFNISNINTPVTDKSNLDKENLKRISSKSNKVKSKDMAEESELNGNGNYEKPRKISHDNEATRESNNIYWENLKKNKKSDRCFKNSEELCNNETPHLSDSNICRKRSKKRKKPDQLNSEIETNLIDSCNNVKRKKTTKCDKTADENIHSKVSEGILKEKIPQCHCETIAENIQRNKDHLNEQSETTVNVTFDNVRRKKCKKAKKFDKSDECEELNSFDTKKSLSVNVQENEEITKQIHKSETVSSLSSVKDREIDQTSSTKNMNNKPNVKLNNGSNNNSIRASFSGSFKEENKNNGNHESSHRHPLKKKIKSNLSDSYLLATDNSPKKAKLKARKGLKLSLKTVFSSSNTRIECDSDNIFNDNLLIEAYAQCANDKTNVKPVKKSVTLKAKNSFRNIKSEVGTLLNKLSKSNNDDQLDAHRSNNKRKLNHIAEIVEPEKEILVCDFDEINRTKNGKKRKQSSDSVQFTISPLQKKSEDGIMKESFFKGSNIESIVGYHL